MSDKNYVKLLKESLKVLPKEISIAIIKDYICDNNLHSEYISLISELSADYINRSNKFIEDFKRDVNALYLPEQFNHNIFKHIDIDEKNWFWYARLLKYTEDEVYPKSNFFVPSYLTERLYNIVKDLDINSGSCVYNELKELKDLVVKLHNKYTEGVDNDDRGRKE